MTLKVDGQDCKFEGLGRLGPSNEVAWLHCPNKPSVKCLEGGGREGRKLNQDCGSGDEQTDHQLKLTFCELGV